MKKILFMVSFLLSAPAVFAQERITIDKPVGGYGDLGSLISNIVSMALIVAAILVFLFLVWGGIQWIMSGGDKAGVESARNRITAALIGLAIVASAWAIIKIIETFFGITIVSGPLSIPSPK